MDTSPRIADFPAVIGEGVALGADVDVGVAAGLVGSEPGAAEPLPLHALARHAAATKPYRTKNNRIIRTTLRRASRSTVASFDARKAANSHRRLTRTALGEGLVSLDLPDLSSPTEAVVCGEMISMRS
jgi:hypothetical protein